MFLNTLVGYVIPFGILLVCNIRLCFELRIIIQRDRKNFKRIQIGKTLCKLKREITNKLAIEMEEIKVNKTEMSTENNVMILEDIEVSSPEMTDKAIETSLILEANERITEMYVYFFWTKINCMLRKNPLSYLFFDTLETQFSELRFSEILDLINKLQLTFSFFTLYPDSI